MTWAIYNFLRYALISWHDDDNSTHVIFVVMIVDCDADVAYCVASGAVQIDDAIAAVFIGVDVKAGVIVVCALNDIGSCA